MKKYSKMGLSLILYDIIKYYAAWHICLTPELQFNFNNIIVSI